MGAEARCRAAGHARNSSRGGGDGASPADQARSHRARAHAHRSNFPLRFGEENSRWQPKPGHLTRSACQKSSTI